MKIRMNILKGTESLSVLGLVKGDYFRVEERFIQGHLGILEVVKNGEEIVHVEFNEMTRPNYYNRFYQNVPKRMSEYNFDMKDKKDAARIESVLLVEKQKMEEQRLTGEFDVVSGASNSIHQSMISLAENSRRRWKRHLQSSTMPSPRNWRADSPDVFRLHSKKKDHFCKIR